MIPHVSISAEQTTVEDVWNHYETVRDSVVRQWEEAKHSLIGGMKQQNQRLLGMSADEVDAYYESILEEVDAQASLFILAATEATLHVDFWTRVDEKRKEPAIRAFRNIYKSRSEHNRPRVRVEEDIFDTWAEQIPEAKSDIAKFKQAFKYRHWLAHGRYWVWKQGRRHDPTGLVRMISSLFERIGLSNP